MMMKIMMVVIRKVFHSNPFKTQFHDCKTDIFKMESSTLLDLICSFQEQTVFNTLVQSMSIMEQHDKVYHQSQVLSSKEKDNTTTLVPPSWELM